ncbi:MAG: nucleotide exchange factor GrpE [Rhodospirillales bacterium]|nr:nucleotide exchange factor GrpE [Rhodospirillales bacterium]MBO6787587.1 nucleotide exchange factor GrpE [Rhodospirillales bacterium]
MPADEEKPEDAQAESAEDVSEDSQPTDEGAEMEGRTDASDDEEDPEGVASTLEAELADTKDKLLRALAEAENVRRRASRDVENASKRAIAGFAREMIVVADNLSRALDAVETEQALHHDSIKALLEGVQMTAREMQNAFSRNGIKKVDPLGEKFDPQMHEAMFEYEDASKPAGTVGQVMEAGYMLGDQPLRPAKVGVTKGGEKQGPAPSPSQQTLDEAAAEKSGQGGGTAYEDDKKPSGTNLDEEL